MPRAEAGSIKAVANAMKARGLTKLRFYCQVCSKACRDENGYKNHIESESHIRQIEALGGRAGKVVQDFSRDFQNEFVRLLSRRFGTRRVKANQVYQEYIADRHHLHMNATKWLSLSEFVKHLGREGICHVEESEQGWYISWIDTSPETLARQDALRKMERSKMDDEQRQRKYLREQIERAEKEKSAGAENGEADRPKVEEGLQRQGEGPLKLGISLGGLSSSKTADEPSKEASTPSQPAATSASSSTPAFKIGINPLKSSSKPAASPAPKPFGGANPLKSSSSSSSAAPRDPSSVDKKKSKPPSSMTMAEKIMMEEMERKKRKAEGGRGPGPMMQPNVKRSRF